MFMTIFEMYEDKLINAGKFLGDSWMQFLIQLPEYVFVLEVVSCSQEHVGPVHSSALLLELIKS